MQLFKRLFKKKPKHTIETFMYPEHWPKHYNANKDPCDVIGFPCSCGSIHFVTDDWVKSLIDNYGKGSSAK